MEDLLEDCCFRSQSFRRVELNTLSDACVLDMAGHLQSLKLNLCRATWAETFSFSAVNSMFADGLSQFLQFFIYYTSILEYCHCSACKWIWVDVLLIVRWNVVVVREVLLLMHVISPCITTEVKWNVSSCSHWVSLMEQGNTFSGWSFTILPSVPG